MNARDHQSMRLGCREPVVPVPRSGLPRVWRIAAVASMALFGLVLTTRVCAQTVQNATALLQQAQAGSAAAESKLGNAYAQGLNGLPKNLIEAMQWWRKAAAQGYPQAEFDLGLGYDHGLGGLPKNPVKAVQWWRKAAAQGFPQAETALGFVYENGEGGLPKNPVEAAKWYRKAAAQGYARAETALGNYYASGEGGLPKNQVKAVQWYRKAAAQGFPQAEYNVGVVYNYGLGGLPKNPIEAVQWWRKAAAQGYKPAIEALQQLQHTSQQTVATTPPVAAAPLTPVVRVPAADNQQTLQNLQRFWTLYFQASNAHVVDFGEPALVQPVSYGAKS